MQTPKSILLHLDNSRSVAMRIRLACALADAFEAQVTAQACSTPVVLRYPYITEYAADAAAILDEIDRDERDRLYSAFIQNAAGSPRLHWAEPVDDGPLGFARTALYADLLLLGQHDPDEPASGELPGSFLSSLLVQSGKPALVLPYTGSWDVIGRNVMIAWKETPESARAVSAALPWLHRAREVHAVSYGPDAQAALRDLRDSLRLHGIASVELHAEGLEEEDVGGSLLSRAADIGSDLLVMGCYGHSRAREWVMGGATRSMLQSMTIPVLMTH